MQSQQTINFCEHRGIQAVPLEWVKHWEFGELE